MGLVVVVLLAALALGRLTGGSLERLGALRLRSRRLVLLAAVAQLLGAVVGGPVYGMGLAVSAGLVVAFLLRNRGVRGTGLIALGLLANALVVGANGAMPVSLHAAGRAGVSVQDVVSGRDPRHVLAGPGNELRWLGDVVPVALPLRPEVVSPGDVLIAAGAAQLVVVGMRAPLTGTAPIRSTPPSTPQGRPRRAQPPLRNRYVRSWGPARRRSPSPRPVPAEPGRSSGPPRS